MQRLNAHISDFDKFLMRVQICTGVMHSSEKELQHSKKGAGVELTYKAAIRKISHEISSLHRGEEFR